MSLTASEAMLQTRHRFALAFLMVALCACASVVPLSQVMGRYRSSEPLPRRNAQDSVAALAFESAVTEGIPGFSADSVVVMTEHAAQNPRYALPLGNTRRFLILNHSEARRIARRADENYLYIEYAPPRIMSDSASMAVYASETFIRPPVGPGGGSYTLSRSGCTFRFRREAERWTIVSRQCFTIDNR